MPELEWNFIVVLCGAAVVLALFIANLVHTIKKNRQSLLLSRLMYVVGALTILFNIYRVHAADDGSTAMFGNLIALVCVAVMFYKNEKSPP